MTLSSLSAYCGINLSGLQLIEYAPTAWVNSTNYIPVLTDAGNWPIEIVFSTGSWLTLPVLPTETFQERARRTDQGMEYQLNVGGVMPRMRPEVSRMLLAMKGYRYIVRKTDRHGQKWLTGTLEYPLELSYRALTGERDSGLNSYEINFTALSPVPAMGYDPVV